jgi:dephospho-CoA kinase
VLRIGLTGPIAAGKSEVSAQLRRLGVDVLDHDEVARSVLAPGSAGQAAAVAAFGTGILAPDGTTDRAALGRIVFADPAARAELEGIVHPRVRALSAAWDDSAEAAGSWLVVHDIPLLVETGQSGQFDAVLVVDAPDEVRVQRLVTERGLTRDDAQRRLAAQATRSERLAAATAVFDGAGSVEALNRQVTRWFESLRESVRGA